jgi:glycosyltransferase involved in cell wall biosynthesis
MMINQLSLPKVSVVLCSFNGEKHIEEQLQSVMQQTYSNLEFIFSDDASTDDTVAIMENLSKADERVKIFRQQTNIGYNGNFVSACQKAAGEFIAICDQDDIWHPEKISRMMAGWVKDVPLMYCNSIRFSGDEIPKDPDDNPLYRRFEGKDLRKLSVFNTISGHALIFKRRFLNSILPVPEKLMYDWWAGAVASCNGGVGYLHDILVYQRVHGNNVSVGKGFTHLDSRYKKDFNLMVLNHQKAFRNIKGISIEQQSFFSAIVPLWETAMKRKFYLPLFLFLVRNRKSVFWYKRKKMPLISHIKHSYLLTKNP